MVGRWVEFPTFEPLMQEYSVLLFGMFYALIYVFQLMTWWSNFSFLRDHPQVRQLQVARERKEKLQAAFRNLLGRFSISPWFSGIWDPESKRFSLRDWRDSGTHVRLNCRFHDWGWWTMNDFPFPPSGQMSNQRCLKKFESLMKERLSQVLRCCFWYVFKWQWHLFRVR